MKKYFYSEGNKKFGPFSFEELKNENINKETLIWFEGLDNWTSAKYIVEIEEILQLKPPPIQTSKSGFISNKDEPLESNEASIIDDDNSNKKLQKKQGMFSHPFSFNGRIRRTEFGITFIIFAIVYSIISSIIKSDSEAYILGLTYIPLLWFLFAQGAKREHDLEFSGWWQLIPFRYLWLIFIKGQVGTNKYGADPKV